MPASFFSPNPKGTGAALYVSFSSKDESVFFKLISQVSWDAKNRSGSFKGGEQLNFKLSQDEVGSILYAIRTKGSVEFYHTSGETNTKGKFTHYLIKETNREGFGLSLTKGDRQFKVGFSLGSTERLSEYLKFALNHIFSAIYSADKKDALERAKDVKSEKSDVKPSATQEVDEDDIF